jgi:hypothetical protein
MSDFDRRVALKMIQLSTHDNKLDLKQLRRLTNEWAGEIATHDPSYEGAHDAVRNNWRDRLTIATREVLELIPADQWHNHRLAPPSLSGWAHRHGIDWDIRQPNLSVEEYRHNLNNSLWCNSNGMSLREIQNPSQSLAEHGVTCELTSLEPVRALPPHRARSHNPLARNDGNGKS